MNYSHILSIKVLTTNTNTNTKKINKDELLGKTIRDTFFNEKISYNNIPVFFREIELKYPNNYFDTGNIVTESPFGADKYIFISVRNTLQKIEKDLKINNVMNNDDTIIFQIMLEKNQIKYFNL